MQHFVNKYNEEQNTTQHALQQQCTKRVHTKPERVTGTEVVLPLKPKSIVLHAHIIAHDNIRDIGEHWTKENKTVVVVD